MSFAATWMDVEISILSEESQRESKYHIIYMWNLRYDTDELIQNRNRCMG